MPPPFDDPPVSSMIQTIWLVFAVIALAGGAAAAPPVDNEALYRERFEAMTKAAGVVTRYDPMETVPGAQPAAALPIATPLARTISVDALDRASAYAVARNSSAFIVWRSGAVQRVNYFRGTTRDSQLISKSLSKPLTAIAVGRAIALGRIKSLDQPVADFIPEWRGGAKSAIRVRHLLDMRSGLMEQTVSSDPDHPVNRAYIDPDHGRVLIHGYPLTHRPGRHFGYSNATSELVAVVIERAAGMRYADFIGRELLMPLGAAGGEIWVDRPGGLAHSGCCMTLPAESWLRLGILLLDDGVANGRRLLPKGYVAAMTTATPQNPYYGLGVWVAGGYVRRRGFSGVGGPGPQVLHAVPYLDRDLFLFDGNANQTVYISRATRMVILRLGDAPPKTLEWDNSTLPNLLIGGIIWRPGTKKPVPQALLAR